jgi:hypothetical protein
VCLIEEKEKLVFNQELSSDTHFKVIWECYVKLSM